jgi:dUTP pyrophosphatase
MKVKIKRLNSLAVLPKYAKSGDAGLDFTAISKEYQENFIEYGTGISIEIPEGYVGLIFPRSSITKMDMMLKNSVGVIDSGYRGEIKFRFAATDGGGLDPDKHYGLGDKIGQLIIMPYPKVELEEVEDLALSDRNSGGFGSTGK